LHDALPISRSSLRPTRVFHCSSWKVRMARGSKWKPRRRTTDTGWTRAAPGACGTKWRKHTGGGRSMDTPIGAVSESPPPPMVRPCGSTRRTRQTAGNYLLRSSRTCRQCYRSHRKALSVTPVALSARGKIYWTRAPHNPPIYLSEAGVFPFHMPEEKHSHIRAKHYPTRPELQRNPSEKVFSNYSPVTTPLAPPMPYSFCQTHI